MPNSVLPKFTDKTCPTHGDTSFVLEGRGYYRCKKCRSQRVSQARVRAKDKLAVAFGAKCQSCGYDRCKAALEFHHVDDAAKDFSISGDGSTRSYARMFEEAKKCVLLCCLCHREVHAGIRECPPLLFIDQSIDQSWIDRLTDYAEIDDRIKQIWLFGSRTKGTARPDSDLDVAVVSTTFSRALDDDAQWENDGLRSDLGLHMQEANFPISFDIRIAHPSQKIVWPSAQKANRRIY